jgi:hypothetical protein
MIVLDEHLQGIGLEAAIARWCRSQVCLIGSLRPGTVIKDESIPHLLRSVRQPTFVTQNWKHFWQRTAAHAGFCIICFTLPPDRAPEISPSLRRLFRLPSFHTKVARMGKVARISSEQVTYYQVNNTQTYVLPLP